MNKGKNLKLNTGIGARLRYFRELRGFSREDIRKMTGISIEAIRSVENDVYHAPRLDNLIAMCLALGVRIEDLLPDDYSDLM